MNTEGIKAKLKQYSACLTFKNINKIVFAWDVEDNLNELMVNNSQVTHPDITNDFQVVLMESDHDGPTAVVETPVVGNNSAAAGAAANTGIQHREDDPAGDKPPPTSELDRS